MRAELSYPVLQINGPVGGGHLIFTNALEQELHALSMETKLIDPLEQGTLPTSMLWRTLRKMYEVGGGQGGILQRIYEGTRNNSDKGGFLINLARLELSLKYQDYPGTIVSDHAYTAIGRDFLIQGDVGAEKPYADKTSIVFVPVDEAREQLIKFGHPEHRIAQVGFFVPQEVRDPMVREFRKDHLRAGRMHLGFFGTVASPKAHFDLLQKTLLPQLKSLIEDQRLKFTIYTWTNKRKAHEIERQVRALWG